MLTSLPPPFTHVLGSLWFPLLLNFSSRIPPMIQDAPGNDVNKAEWTTLSKICINAHKMGLLSPYTRDTTHPPNRLTKITVMLLHWCMTPQNLIPLGIITSYFSNFLFWLGICFTLWIVSCTPLGHDFQNLSHLHNPEVLCFLLIFSPILICNSCPATLPIIAWSLYNQYS